MPWFNYTLNVDPPTDAQIAEQCDLLKQLQHLSNILHGHKEVVHALIGTDCPCDHRRRS